MAITSKIPTSDKWPVTTERFVAFIDIMGFKDMVMKMPHEEIYRIMKMIGDAKELNAGILTDAKNQKLVRSTTYPDSIMLYSKDKTVKAFDALVTAVAGLTSDLFAEGVPHKGAIAYGKMTLDQDRSIFFGQPLIDAYLLQEELHFYGVIMHGSVEEIMSKKISGQTFVKKYDCHLKNGKSGHFTVYPIFADSHGAENYPEDHEKIINSLHQMRFRTSGHLRRYIDNTESYFKSLIKE